MNVTQQEIDNSILLIDRSIASLAIEAANTLKTGCQPCEDFYNEYNKLIAYKYLLEQGLTAVDLGCIQMRDLWNAVQFVKQYVCGTPALEETYNWLTTSTGQDILTEELNQIIVT